MAERRFRDNAVFEHFLDDQKVLKGGPFALSVCTCYCELNLIVVGNTVSGCDLASLNINQLLLKMPTL